MFNNIYKRKVARGWNNMPLRVSILERAQKLNSHALLLRLQSS